MTTPKKETSVEISPPLASYAPIEVEGSGVPYTGDGRQGDTRGTSPNYSYTRKDMAKSKKVHLEDGSRKKV